MLPVRLTRRCCHHRTQLGFSLRRARLRPASSRLQSSTAAPEPPPSTPQPPTEPGERLFAPFANDDNFPGAAGFWPREHAHIISFRDEGSSELVKEVQDLIDAAAQEVQASTRPKTIHNHIPRLYSHKVDLSYADPMKSEQDGYRQAVLQQYFSIALPSAGFRRSNTMRWAAAAYIDNVQPYLELQETQPLSEQDQSLLDEALSKIFADHNLKYFLKRGYSAEDVASWAWILSSETADVAVRRAITINEERLKHNKPENPRWIILQVLRSPHINAGACQYLVKKLLHLVDQHRMLVGLEDGTTFVEVGGAGAEPIKGMWDYGSATLLAIRLLRHARRVHPASYEGIANLAVRLLLSLHKNGPQGYERLAYSCNRLLSLIALPTGVRPFRSIEFQQRAQLVLLKAMMALKPQVPLNREGYRALIKVQLVHEKLEEEKAWANAKADSWPPWRKAKLGIEENVEYPGKESRAMKLLRRMLESGYAHFSWEKTAAVLAGWDTDRSPTIQTRHILKMPPKAPLAGVLGPDGQQPSSFLGELWAARIIATRSVREAWACFTSYCETIEPNARRIEPYRAMFSKLVAEQHTNTPDDFVLPGDAKETFPDPPSPRDLVYISSVPPTIHDLYKRMIEDGVRPCGRLLTDLVWQAKTISEALQYLKDSSYGEVKKDVLLHAANYSRHQVRDAISSIPDHFFAAYIGMLVRCGDQPSDLVVPQWYTRDIWLKNRQQPSEQYAMMLLYISETTYLPAWHAMLEALLSRYQNSTSSGKWVRRLYLRAWNVVDLLLANGIDTDLTTFRIVVSLIHPPLATVRTSAVNSPNLASSEKAKMLFQKAVYKIVPSPSATWLNRSRPVLAWPDPEDIRALIETLGIAGDLNGLVQLSLWMHHHFDGLRANDGTRKNSQKLRLTNRIIMRIFLEGWWTEDAAHRHAHSIDQSHLATVRKMFGVHWPADESVEELLSSWPTWLRRVQTMINARREREQRAAEVEMHDNPNAETPENDKTA